uniref:Uncharacterized protein n=1 Tax=Mycena chlorophos TaxID=658473 RepID=A0ABQ0LE74_MYCCL|nr:predicted protein [Mycena chlorophos]
MSRAGCSSANSSFRSPTITPCVSGLDAAFLAPSAFGSLGFTSIVDGSLFATMLRPTDHAPPRYPTTPSLPSQRDQHILWYAELATDGARVPEMLAPDAPEATYTFAPGPIRSAATRIPAFLLSASPALRAPTTASTSPNTRTGTMRVCGREEGEGRKEQANDSKTQRTSTSAAQRTSTASSRNTTATYTQSLWNSTTGGARSTFYVQRSPSMLAFGIPIPKPAVVDQTSCSIAE